MENIVTAECAGDGTWELVCGDRALGPPCIAGEFYGHVMVICKCPSDISLDDPGEPQWSTPGDTPLWSCPESVPTSPLPFNVPQATFDPDALVPQLLFDAEIGADSKGVWTWCPCAGTDSETWDYPEGDESSCPYPGLDCTGFSGDGFWVFRGGNDTLGPPPVLGRFYGETVFIGYCCGPIESASSMSATSLSSISTPCPMPWFPAFDWFVDETFGNFNALITDDDAGCGMSGACSGWLWCQCAVDTACSQSFAEYDANSCPWPGPDTAAPNEPGRWGQFDGTAHHGEPPIIGRFYGEILYYCPCEQSLCSLSSSSSLCELGGVTVTGDGNVTPSGGADPSPNGNYNPAGWYNGMMYYQSINGWYLVFDPVVGLHGSWILQQVPPGDALSQYFTLGVSIQDPPIGTYTPAAGATGNPVVSCCAECDADTGACSGSITLNVSGLTDDCTGVNGNHVLLLVGSGADIYYTLTLPANGCNTTLVVQCDCGGWVVYITALDCGAAVDQDNAWISEPAESFDHCPPAIAYTMHITYEDCGGGSPQIPTVSIS